MTSTAPPRPKVCFVVSAPLTAEAFLCGHIAALSEHYDIHLVANAEPRTITHPALQRTIRHYAPIVRPIAPVRDLQAVVSLIRLMRRERYALVHSLTPKAGLVAALAAYMARVPVRLHTFTGQVWATRNGTARLMLKAIDQLIARLDTHILVDSVSQRDFLRAEGVLGPEDGVVLVNGSVSGVDPARFKPDAAARLAVRERYGIVADAIVFLFVGRLKREKGVVELAHAFGALAARRADVHLVLAGPDEDGLEPRLRAAAGPGAKHLVFVGHTDKPERYMAAADIFCLPSHREGFGSVVIEAAAAGLPAIGTRIYGITDAIEDRITGVLVEPRQNDALARAMGELAADPALRAQLGAAAHARALKDFSSHALSRALVDFYADTLADTQRPDAQAL